MNVNEEFRKLVAQHLGADVEQKIYDDAVRMAASASTVPVYFVLDDDGEAFEIHWFCSETCRASYVPAPTETLDAGTSPDWLPETQCETCGKDVQP